MDDLNLQTNLGFYQPLSPSTEKLPGMKGGKCYKNSERVLSAQHLSKFLAASPDSCLPLSPASVPALNTCLAGLSARLYREPHSCDRSTSDRQVCKSVLFQKSQVEWASPSPTPTPSEPNNKIISMCFTYPLLVSLSWATRARPTFPHLKVVSGDTWGLDLLLCYPLYPMRGHDTNLTQMTQARVIWEEGTVMD